MWCGCERQFGCACVMEVRLPVQLAACMHNMSCSLSDMEGDRALVDYLPHALEIKVLTCRTACECTSGLRRTSRSS